MVNSLFGRMAMILYGFTSPNVMKVMLMLEECGVTYDYRHICIWDGEQFSPEFVALNPNCKVPVLIDLDYDGGRTPLTESGAILFYLAEKAGQLFPSDFFGRTQVMQWLMFQIASIGPMFGQANHFRRPAPPGNDYALNRYRTEVHRLFDLLEQRLRTVPFLAGEEYSIADISTYPWTRYWDVNNVPLDRLPGVARWMAAIEQRAATSRVLDGWTVMQERDEQRRIGATPATLDKMYGRGEFTRG